MDDNKDERKKQTEYEKQKEYDEFNLSIIRLGERYKLLEEEDDKEEFQVELPIFTLEIKPKEKNNLSYSRLRSFGICEFACNVEYNHYLPKYVYARQEDFFIPGHYGHLALQEMMETGGIERIKNKEIEDPYRATIRNNVIEIIEALYQDTFGEFFEAYIIYELDGEPQVEIRQYMTFENKILLTGLQGEQWNEEDDDFIAKIEEIRNSFNAFVYKTDIILQSKKNKNELYIADYKFVKQFSLSTPKFDSTDRDASLFSNTIDYQTKLSAYAFNQKLKVLEKSERVIGGIIIEVLKDPIVMPKITTKGKVSKRSCNSTPALLFSALKITGQWTDNESLKYCLIEYATLLRKLKDKEHYRIVRKEYDKKTLEKYFIWAMNRAYRMVTTKPQRNFGFNCLQCKLRSECFSTWNNGQDILKAFIPDPPPPKKEKEKKDVE